MQSAKKLNLLFLVLARKILQRRDSPVGLPLDVCNLLVTQVPVFSD
jgi:hypothetical protein